MGRDVTEIVTVRDADALAHAAAEQFATIAEVAIATRRRFTVALAGDSTPCAAYALLATEAFRKRMDWERTEVFWGDERCVPPAHADSNYRMAQEALLAHVCIPAQQVHRVRCEADPQRAAADCAQELDVVFADRPPRTQPRLDLILLGMGEDGHTASLFPDTPAIREMTRPVVAHYVHKLGAWRITFTPALINAAANVTFLVAGADKAERLREVLGGPYQPDRLPAQVVRPTDGRLLWLVDATAAGCL